MALWERSGQVFCDGCGLPIQDQYYYKWIACEGELPDEWEYRMCYNSHVAHHCIGFVVMTLMVGSQLRATV